MDGTGNGGRFPKRVHPRDLDENFTELEATLPKNHHIIHTVAQQLFLVVKLFATGHPLIIPFQKRFSVTGLHVVRLVVLFVRVIPHVPGIFPPEMGFKILWIF